MRINVCDLCKNEVPEIDLISHDRGKHVNDLCNKCLSMIQDHLRGVKDDLMVSLIDRIFDSLEERITQKNETPKNEMKISDCLFVPFYLINRLNSHGIKVINQLISKTEREMREFQFIGSKSMDYLKRGLDSIGLSFKGNAPFAANKD